MFFALLVIKLAGFLRDILVVKYFGLSALVDVYLYALVVPTLLYGVISYSFSNYFIPNYLLNKERFKENENLIKQYAFYILLIFIVLSFLLSLFFSLGLPELLINLNSSLFATESLKTTFVGFSQWVAVYFFFYSLATLFTALLQAEHHYNSSIYPQILIPLTSVVLVWTAHNTLGLSSAVYGLAWGAVLSFALLLIFIKKRGLITFKIHFSDIARFHQAKNLREFWYLLIAFSFPSLMSFIDSNIAAFLATALGISILSHLSEWHANKKIPKIADAIQRGIIFATLFLIPFCSFIIIFAPHIVTILYQRGNFTEADTLTVSQILQSHIFSVYLNFLLILAYRVISSLEKNKFFLKLYLVLFLTKMILNYIFVNLWGIVGLPLASLVMNFAGTLAVYYYLNQHIPFLEAHFSKRFLNILSATLGFGILFYFFQIPFANIKILNQFLIGVTCFLMMYSLFLLSIIKSLRSTTGGRQII